MPCGQLVPQLTQRRLGRALWLRATLGHDLCAEDVAAVARILVRLAAAQSVVDVNGGHSVAERFEDVPEARRVGSAGDEAPDLAAGRDQVVLTNMRIDAPEELLHRAIVARRRASATERGQAVREVDDLVGP